MSVKKSHVKLEDESKAIEKFYEEVYQEDISLVVFFCSSLYDLGKISHLLSEKFGDIEVVGCTSCGEIGKDGYAEHGISGFSFSNDGIISKVKFFENLESITQGDSSNFVADVLSEFEHEEGFKSKSNMFSFLLIDGLSIQEEKMTSLLYNSMGNIPLFGGSAGDDLKFESTYVYYNGEFHKNAGILALVHTDFEFTVFKAEHFVEGEGKIVITDADPSKRIVNEINGEIAADEYARLIGVRSREELVPEVFSQYPVVVKIGGKLYVRSIQKVNDDGSLTFYCAIDEGIVLTLAKGIDFIDNLNTVLDKVKSKVGEPQLVIGFDCILRKLEIQETKIKDNVGKVMSENNVVGFSTYGEQYNSMHVNQTFTGVAIGKKKAA